ncbi:hypothetical protein CEK25_013042 [Fusarium fujikuroi]|nr:hypothetical protein CEK25_013042 [Fusarium fujikuroi]
MLGFSNTPMAPLAIVTMLETPQEPSNIIQLLTSTLLMDPLNRPMRPKSSARESLVDAVEAVRPQSEAARRLLLLQSHLCRSSLGSASLSSDVLKHSWLRKSLKGRSDSPDLATRPAPVHASSAVEASTVQGSPAAERTTWTNGPSNVAPTYSSYCATDLAPIPDATKKLGRQLSVASSTNNYTEMHRSQQAETTQWECLASPPSGHSRRILASFHISESVRGGSRDDSDPRLTRYDDDLRPSNRSPIPIYESLDKAPIPKSEMFRTLDSDLRDVPPSHHSRSRLPHTHDITPSSTLKPGGPISSDTWRAQEAPDEDQDELLDEEDELLLNALPSTHGAVNQNKPLRQSALQHWAMNPYPTNPQPMASLFADGHEVLLPLDHEDLNPRRLDQYKWTDEESEWAASAYAASIWAASAVASVSSADILLRLRRGAKKLLIRRLAWSWCLISTRMVFGLRYAA